MRIFYTAFLAFSLAGIITSTQDFLGKVRGYPGTASHHTLLLKLFGFCMGLQTKEKLLWYLVPFYSTEYLFGRGQEPKSLLPKMDVPSPKLHSYAVCSMQG